MKRSHNVKWVYFMVILSWIILLACLSSYILDPAECSGKASGLEGRYIKTIIHAIISRIRFLALNLFCIFSYYSNNLFFFFYLISLNTFGALTAFLFKQVFNILLTGIYLHDYFCPKLIINVSYVCKENMRAILLYIS